MKRRSNKSAKVPNVRLRPAQPGAREQTSPQTNYWVQDTQGDPDACVKDVCPRPFRGVVVCATGVSDKKPVLFKQALELGATSTSAFTDRVTHLIAENHGGAKYMCALERRIPILQPSWITENYTIWLRGDDVDLKTSVEQHRLPIFSGVTLSLSGIDSITRRTKINKLLTLQGGTYLKNLERPVKVTHLLCSGDMETEKMYYAEKFNKSGEAQIQIIWEEWFWDSLEFGGRFDEQTYLVGQPRPERRLSFVAPQSELALPVQSSATDTAPVDPQASSSHPSQGDEPEDDSQADDEPAIIKRRIPAETLHMWHTLLKPRGYEIEQGQLVRSPSKSQELQKKQEMHDSSMRGDSGPAGTGSVIEAFRRANSFAAAQVHAVPTLPRQPFRRSTPLPGADDVTVASSSGVIDPPQPDSSTQRLFSGIAFRVLGEARCAAVRKALEGCGGRIIGDNDMDAHVDFIIVRLVSGSKIYRDEKDDSERAKFRTECWLERCIFEERECSPNEHVSFVPLGIEHPIVGAEAVSLSYSGLDQSQLCCIKRLARALGITLAPNFHRRCTHLLCPSRTGAKFDKALEWGVPVVSMEWFGLMIARGAVPITSPETPVSAEVEKVAPKSAKARGKEREQEGDCGIVDITNKGDDGHPSPKNKKIGLPLPMPPRDDNDSAFRFGAGGPFDNQPSHRGPIHGSPSPQSREMLGEHFNRLTRTDIQREKALTRIPSSTSPSPMRIPNGRASCSPSKVPTKALQDSITTLLGKRPPEEEEPVLPRQARAGKRTRPLVRTKSMSRPPSVDPTRYNFFDSLTSPSMSASPPPQSPSSHGDYDVLQLSFGSESGPDDTMRVVYEDPGERHEKERLLSLFETQTLTDDVKKAAPKKEKKGRAAGPRRSARMAGF